MNDSMPLKFCRDHFFLSLAPTAAPAFPTAVPGLAAFDCMLAAAAPRMPRPIVTEASRRFKVELPSVPIPSRSPLVRQPPEYYHALHGRLLVSRQTGHVIS